MEPEATFAPTGAAPAPLDLLPCGVLRFDDRGTVVAANATLHDMLGYAPGEIEGRHVERLLTVAGRIFYQTHLFPLLRLHGAAREIFLLLRHATVPQKPRVARKVSIASVQGPGALMWGQWPWLRMSA